MAKSQFCRKCNKSVQDQEAVIEDQKYLCPTCKEQLSFFASTYSTVSYGQIRDYDQKTPESFKNLFEGKIVDFQPPAADPHQLECEHILKHDPNQIDALLHLGLIFKSQKKFKEAKDHLTRILTINPSFQTAYQHLADISLIEENLPQAIEYLQSMQRLDPDNYLILQNLGLAHYHAKSIKKAIHCFERAKSMCPHEAKRDEFDSIVVKLKNELQNHI